MPQVLGDAVRHASASSNCPTDAPVERIRWLECFTGEEKLTNFCEATDPSGNLESNSSSGYKEYQDRLRAIALRKEGKEKSEIASAIGRSTRFVQTWWNKEPKEVPRPPGVHEYLKPEFWRDIEIIRGFGKGLGIYEEVVPTAEWLQPMADGAAFNGAGYRLKYDKEGRMRPQGNQHAKDGLVPGRMPALDKLTQKLLVEQGIDDRVLKRPGILWYPDGSADAIEHRHEAWTALMSFGQPRILTIDKQPVLLRDGDLILFGTQRHGVPKMCEEAGGTFDEYGGRISVVFFFMPTGQQAKGAEPWKAIMDQQGPSRKASAMLHDAHLGASAEMQALLSGPHGKSVRYLQDLGFSEQEAAAALRATAFDLERAAEVLLNGGGPALMAALSAQANEETSGINSLGPGLNTAEQIDRLCARLGELQAQRVARQPADFTCSEVPTDDEALARKLQQEESGCGACGAESMDWEEAAILEQLSELENQAASSPEALRTQFAAYEEMLDAKDADEWDGRGDLMVREWRRAHLHIEQQEPTTVYAFGCGSLREQSFFELLSLHSIRCLYDFRAAPEKASAKHFAVRSLEVACKARSILYRHIALGRETAYGILKHLKEDEGRNSLAELVWHARRKRTAFLGAEEDWRLDNRLAIAMRLQEAGHTVMHVRPDGGTEEQPAAGTMEVPDHLANEETRLRTLEKQRLSGEAMRAHKSATSRSTEVVAQRLTQPRKEIDAGEELRKANTQAELCRVQRRLADLQRRTEDSADIQAGLGPKLMNANKWVRADALKQRENLAAGKTKDGKEKGAAAAAAGSVPVYSWASTGGTSGGNPDFCSRSPGTASAAGASPSDDASANEASSVPSELLIECSKCATAFPWSELQFGDGQCSACLCAAEELANEMDSQQVEAEGAALPEMQDVTPSSDVLERPAVPEEDTAADAAPPVEQQPRSAWRAKRRTQRAAGASVT